MVLLQAWPPGASNSGNRQWFLFSQKLPSPDVMGFRCLEGLRLEPPRSSEASNFTLQKLMYAKQGHRFWEVPIVPTGICTFGKPMSTEYISPLTRVLTVAHMNASFSQRLSKVLETSHYHVLAFFGFLWLSYLPSGLPFESHAIDVIRGEPEKSHWRTGGPQIVTGRLSSSRLSRAIAWPGQGAAEPRPRWPRNQG